MKKVVVSAHQLITPILVLMLLLPQNPVYAQDETPPETAAETGAESDSAADSADGSDEGGDSGEAADEAGSGSQSDEESSDGGEPTGDETSSEDGEPPAEDSGGAAAEEEYSEETGESGTDETDDADGDAASMGEEGTDETVPTGSGSSDEEQDVEDGDTASADDEDGEAADESGTGSGTSDEEQGEEDGADAQEDAEEETPEVAEVVQQMAQANAQLVDEQGQPIALASEEAAVLLEANAAALPGIILMSSAAASVSTTIAQDNADQLDGGNDGIGQSFTATIDGQLTSIEIGSNSTGNFNLKIYLGASVSGAEFYSQVVVLTDTVNNTGGVVNSYTYQTLALSSPVAVAQGQLYTFGIEGVMPAMAVDTAGGGTSYTGGDLYTLNAGSWSVSLNRDMAFRVHIQGTGGSAGDGEGEDGEEEENTKSLRAQFITKPDDFKLVPQGLCIQCVLSYIYEYGVVAFNLPAGVDADNISILFWNGSSWSQLPGVIVMEDGIQGPAVGPGTYVMVVK